MELKETNDNLKTAYGHLRQCRLKIIQNIKLVTLSILYYKYLTLTIDRAVFSFIKNILALKIISNPVQIQKKYFS